LIGIVTTMNATVATCAKNSFLDFFVFRFYCINIVFIESLKARTL
jgi:hypothetical protein